MVNSYKEFLETNNRKKITVIKMEQKEGRTNIIIQVKCAGKVYTYDRWLDWCEICYNRYVTNPNEVIKFAKSKYKGDFYKSDFSNFDVLNERHKITIQKIDRDYIYTDKPILVNFNEKREKDNRTVYSFPEFLKDVEFYISNPAILKPYFDKYTNQITKLLDKDRLFFDEIQKKYTAKSFIDKIQLQQLIEIARYYCK